MKFNSKSFFAKLIFSHLITIFISLTVIGLMFGYLIQNYYFGLKEWEATSNGRRIAELVSENISEGNLKSPNPLIIEEKITTIARSSNMDISLIDEKGDVLINSSSDNNFKIPLEPEEMKYVLKGNNISKKIMGPEYKNLLMVFPLLKTDEKININPRADDPNQKIIGCLVIQSSLHGVANTVNNIIKFILYSFIVAIIAAIFLSISFTQRVTKPLEDIKNAALSIPQGKFKKVKLAKNSSDEITHLVNTFNSAVEQLDETLQKKKRLKKMRKEFVANVSHEFRAPLTSIKGFLELILDHNLSPSEIKNYTEIMYKDTEYLEHLLSDLLELGQLESENFTLKKELVKPEKLVLRAVNSLQSRIEEKNIKLKLDFKENLTKINCDLHRIHQVLINLLDNALTYSPVNGKITITIEKVKGKINFTISDQGPGIPSAEIPKIWQRFYKINMARTREEKKGSGLGLAIVKDIILRHQGDIFVKSKLNKGTSFIFSLPL